MVRLVRVVPVHPHRVTPRGSGRARTVFCGINIKRLMAALLALLPGCSEIISETELPGVYIASFRGVEAILSVKADHTYTHVVQLENGQILETGATRKAFQAAPKSVQLVVEFSEFDAIPAFKEVGTSGWACEVERTWLGRIQFCFDSDVGYCYVKQSHP